ncbi:sensor histidine kinase [Streptococcus macacae]|uniref:histidine kinase n=1 Tax=Streptococcus macacae NCTC 11558 TaxID=764298 RepID=G5JV25_9STRE|nr:sensor histidine kinase [Streptococcus macacae]EHJ52745.1 histidine kinase [Streptococcus macacae NCTC 11558]SUN79328.1 two component system histidine kinase [Streptococcus macacae NCTC 11558]
MSNLKAIRLLRQLLILINFTAVVYNASLYLFATKYITEKGLSHSLLEKLNAVPAAPTVMFWSSILSFFCLLLVMQMRNRLSEQGKTNNGWLLSLELLLLLTTFIFLQSSYNGLILLVFIDVFYSFTDFYILQRRRYWFFFIALSFGALLISNYDILSLVIKIPSLDTYLDFFPTTVRLITLSLKNFIASLNIIVFIISLVTYIMYTVSENHKIEEELRMASQTNIELNSYVAVTEKIVEDRERKRLSREIHDTLGHALTGISAGIDAVRVLVDLDPNRAKEQLKSMSGVVRDGIRDVRRSLEKLRPGALEGRTLKDGLEKMVSDYQELSKLKINFSYEWGDVDLDMTKEDVIFRVIQESVTNSLRHGHAQTVTISMVNDTVYYIIIQDDGVGFDDLHYGYGLTQMKERLSIIGGKAEFYNDNGFKTIISIPKSKGEEGK